MLPRHKPENRFQMHTFKLLLVHPRVHHQHLAFYFIWMASADSAHKGNLLTGDPLELVNP